MDTSHNRQDTEASHNLLRDHVVFAAESGSPHTPHTPPTPATPGVQYASYPDTFGAQAYSEVASDEAYSEKHAKHLQGIDSQRPWLPLQLQRWFWLSYVIFLLGLFIALEVAYAMSQRNLGWEAKTGFSRADSYMHYVISLPPVIVAMGIVAIWVGTDVEIKKLQPYIDLYKGNTPAHRSLLLNYSRQTNFLVWVEAAANRHSLVFLATIMALLTLTFQPLASALLEIRDTYIPEGEKIVQNLGSLGLHQDLQFQDLTYFLAATNFAAASVLYQLPDPPFIHENFAVAPFTIPHQVADNGTVLANTFAVQSEPNCVAVEPVKIQRGDGTGWDVSGSLDGCSMNWSVDKNTTTLFGTGVPSCTNGPYAGQTPAFLPVVFWFFTYQPTALASATFCHPKISFHNVNVTVDLGSSNITQIVETGMPSNAPSNLSFVPFAYNGIAFDHLPANPDRFISGRRDAIQLQMPSAMLQAAAQSDKGIVSFFQNNDFVDMSQSVYTMYLNLIAKSVYFMPVNEPLATQVSAWRKRVWLTSVATHLLAAGLLILALFATYIQIQHRKARSQLVLFHEPGTIASAVSLGAQTGLGALLAREAPQSEKQFKEVLKDRKFRIDPVTRRIVMAGEEGYEEAVTPRADELLERRRSVFAAFQRQKSSGSGLKPPSPNFPV